GDSATDVFTAEAVALCQHRSAHHHASDPAAHLFNHSTPDKISQRRGGIPWRSWCGSEVNGEIETACAVSRRTHLWFLHDEPAQFYFDLCVGHVFPPGRSVGGIHHTLVHQSDCTDAHAGVHSRISESNYQRDV